VRNTIIQLSSKERKRLISQMKRETKPSRRLRMHIVLLLADELPPSQIARVLYCSRTTVYQVGRRFVEEGEEAFDDRAPRGPAPLLDEGICQRLEELVLEESPREHGFNRSRWTCAVLATQVLKEFALRVCPETVRRALHRLGLRWRRPRPVPPLSHPQERKRRLLEILNLLLTSPKEEGILFQDETELHLNPKVGFAWMRRGQQGLLPTPGTNQKAVLSGGVNWRSGKLVLVTGARRATDLFLAFLEQVRTRLRRYRKIHVIADQDRSHTSRAINEYLERWKHRLEVHLLPAWSPDANPMEMIWLVLHQTVTVNHSEPVLDELVTHARQLLEERQPFRLKLPKVYKPLLKQIKRQGVQLSCVPI
jgi:transposase